ncbi:MAG: HupE/UreJ family protein [Gammaproteobacteria bacterium]|nr:HupE/UreJ family protein [Gammaproteobacteria bacterium]
MHFLKPTAVLLTLLIASAANAHDARPVFVQIQETDAGVMAIWKIPPSMPAHALPRPILPANCTAAEEPLAQNQAGGHVFQQQFQCTEGLAGGLLVMRFPAVNPSLSTLVRVELAGGEKHVRILKPGETEWTIPAAEARLAVAGQYTDLGIRHIWAGIDHLLFVACLLWIARTPRKLLITITGFTIAHSLTLALSALELIRLPVPPVEAAIALSVVFLAVEIARGDKSSLTYRYPIVVSCSFGLLHGFGFAAVLRQIGLPQTELPTALLFFNVGVEIGQVLFVAALVTMYVLARAVAGRPANRDVLSVPAWERWAKPASYVIGSIASYWMIDRVAGFWA